MSRPLVPFAAPGSRGSARATSRRAAPGRSLLAGLALVTLAGGLAAGLAAGAGGAAPGLGQVAPTPTPRLLRPIGSTATPPPDSTPASTPTTAATPRLLRPLGPTPTPTPTATPRPTATPTPPPTLTPTPPPALRVAFAAEDWAGGYYRGDREYYGRPWVAVYGARSAYPWATLTFALAAPPSGPATLTLTGLDDEWAGPNEIALELNGRRVYAGPSPFPDWDGVGTGEDAAWTAVAFALPAELLRAGPNEVAVANLAPAANFGTPPYVLLAEATLEVPASEDGTG